MNCKILNFKIEEPEIITGDRFYFYCFTNSIRYQKTDFLFQSGFWRGYYQEPLYNNNINKIITGHSDYSITEQIVKQYKNQMPSLKKWFGTNMDVKNELTQGIPIGLTNYCNDSKDHLIYGDHRMIMNCLKLEKINKHLCYLNVGNTHPERVVVQEKFQNEPWSHHSKVKNRQEFLFDIYNSKFVLCPRGNGIDTHRMWETLYLQSIPIVKRCQAMSYFEDLPILWIDDWNEVTKELLEDKYEEMISKEYPLYKLKLSYWTNLISQ